MMRSATAFLPDSMITFMNLERSTEPNFGSGRMSRLGTSRRRGIAHFLLLQLASGDARASKDHKTLHLLEQPARKPAPFAASLTLSSGAWRRTWNVTACDP